LCQALKKPGGIVPNPNVGAPGAPAQIPNPGFNVAIKAEENLKLAAYLVRHQRMISRPATVAAITIEAVRKFKEMKAAEESHKDLTKKPIINDKNWQRTLMMWKSISETTSVKLTFCCHMLSERMNKSLPILWTHQIITRVFKMR
jgi:hypothetical protein